MSREQRRLDQYPLRTLSPAGLTVQMNSNGSLRRMDHGDIMLNLFLGNEMEGPPANLYLRRHGERLDVCPLLAPHSGGAVQRAEATTWTIRPCSIPSGVGCCRPHRCRDQGFVW